ncbi:MAG TPA: zf-HC2 domain-containing protein [Pyrinomonadaceae bacterium]|nr:zf-HC2 domain-containing protein [Pyrinomonadaceae bacterium]
MTGGGHTKDGLCARTQATAAYLDGELDAHASRAFEEHLKECAACSATLAEQRRLLCLLDAAFDPRASGRGGDGRVALPKDFARVVTARAQTDICGPLRGRAERLFALKLCAALLLASAALLGTSLFDSALAPAWAFARTAAGVISVAAHALADTASAAALVLRAVGGRLVGGPAAVVVFQWAVLACAALLLLLLVGGYRRAAAELDDPR